MKKVWIVFISVFVLSFAVLIWIGTEVYQTQPPIPQEVVIEETGVNLNNQHISLDEV